MALSIDDRTEALPETIIGTDLAVLGLTVQYNPDTAQAAVDKYGQIAFPTEPSLKTEST